MSDEDLFRLCDEVQALDGRVTIARLREAAGGGGHDRLKAVVEAWRVRRDEAAARRAGKGMPQSRGQDGDLDSKVQGTGRRRGGNVEAPATAGASPRGDRSAVAPVTLGDVEQAEIAMEAGRVKAALSGGEAAPTETPGEPDVPSSIEQAEAEVAEVLAAAAGPEGADGPPGAAAASPASATPTPPAPSPSGMRADAEISRLQAHVEDLRRENAMLWDQVRHEREARIREIELLNGMIQAMRR